MARLEGKATIVTGGAEGIGETTAKMFAQEGAKVVVADINHEKGEKVAEGICQGGGDAVFNHLDVRQEDDWKSVIEATIKKYGKVNVIVNNAGISMPKDLELTTLDEWNNIFSINSTGVFLGVREGILAMKDSKEPCSIVNRSSIGGQIADPELSAYCASKGAVTILTKAAALYCAKKGYNIRVNSVHPGWIRTPMAEYEARGMGYEPEDFFAEIGKVHPLGWIGEPIDVAYLDIYLASDESRWVTGSEFTVDGGYTAQ